jgi:hypothetical protein
MVVARNTVDATKFNPAAVLPYELRPEDFQMAMQDVYDFFHDVNGHLMAKGLQRLDDLLRPAIMSGVLSDMLTASLAKHSRVLRENQYFNGHPDLIVQGIYAGNAVKAGKEGVEVKATRKARGRCGHARSQGTMDVRVRLRCGHRDRTGNKPQADDFHGSLPGSRDGRGFPAKSPRRTWHPHCHPAQGWHTETQRELGLACVNK